MGQEVPPAIPEKELEPGGRVAKTLTAVLAPLSCPASEVFRRKFALAPLGRPARFSARAGVPFGAHQSFPCSSFGIAQSHPHEVKKLVGQNPAMLGRIAAKFRIEHNEALTNESGGVRGVACRIAQVAAVANFNCIARQGHCKMIAGSRQAGRKGAMGDDCYSKIGGADGCRALSEAFYERVDRDPLLRPLFPGTTLKCAIEAFAAFLSQFLGGNAEDAARRWWLSLRESHQRFEIGPQHRDAWMANMTEALADVRIEEPARKALIGFFRQSSAYLVNHGEAFGGRGAHADAIDDLSRELQHRWDAQQTLDNIVAAIRSGNDGHAVSLTSEYVRTSGNRSVNAGILAQMIGSRRAALQRYARETLERDPDLAHERHAGRTLLHAASAHGDSALVELLLSLGLDPAAQDGGGHSPLYSLGNECQVPGAGAIVRILTRAGADVNAADGVKHCTPLHMAARRGNVEIAEALIDSGANIEARDSLGDTPLRRAVNCNKHAVAALLLSKGADRHSSGSKGLTPFLAARSDAMKRVFLTTRAS